MRGHGKEKKQLCILSLDGVPYSFLKEGIAAGRFANLGRLGEAVAISSALPPVSSVAWATFSTGVNPGNHGIFGFLERDPKTMAERIPSSRDLSSPSLWTMLNAAGKRTIAINVPLTYPPQEVDGLLVSCFLCTDLERGVMPRSLLPRLRRLDYRIDPDPSLATTDREAYLNEVFATFHARRRALFDLVRERWDLFMCHVMMTDRINHFFFADGFDPSSEFHARFWQFYDEVDDLVGEVDALLPPEVDFLLLSDHGFCQVKKEVDLNAALAAADLLAYQEGEGLHRIAPSSRAYSLLPGRVYVNLEGREKGGPVAPADYAAARDEAATVLAGLKDEDGNPIVERVLLREEAYSGKRAALAPDLVLLPQDGYELKARLSPGPLFAPASLRSGMHTYGDAFALLRGRRLREGGSILDATPTVFESLGVSIPSHLEGTSLLANGGRP